METTNQNSDKGSGWTPEHILLAVKEGATALIGMVVVVITLFLAIKGFSYVGKEEMADAKDVLMLMLGLAGVVVGYYFGRVPADARATQAQEQANTATAQTEQVSAEAQSAADQLDQILARMAATAGVAAQGGGAPAGTAAGVEARRTPTTTGTGEDVEDLKGVRDMLRQVSRASYRR